MEAPGPPPPPPQLPSISGLVIERQSDFDQIDLADLPRPELGPEHIPAQTVPHNTVPRSHHGKSTLDSSKHISFVKIIVHSTKIENEITLALVR